MPIKDALKRLAERRPVAVALATQKRYGRDYGSYLAATVTYYGFLSVFPLILLGLSVVGFFLAENPEAQREWARALSGSIPGLGPIIGKNIEGLIEARGATGLIGAASLAWTGTGVVEASGYALGVVFRIPPYQNFLKKKLWSLG